MPVSTHGPRAQEKLDIILGQVTGLRSRLNWLAVQDAVYLFVAIGIAVSAVVFAGAVLLSPLQFLVLAGSVALSGFFGVLFATRSAWRGRSNAVRAAALADERAGLKGRLTTIVETVSYRRRGLLWSYLVEDALSHREEFTPAQIERRRIARSWWTPLAAMALAAVLIPIAERHVEYAEKVAAQLRPAGVRVEVDGRNEKMNAKIREHALQKVPFLLVVGDKEAEANKVNVRTRGKEKTEDMPAPEFVVKVGKLIRERVALL